MTSDFDLQEGGWLSAALCEVFPGKKCSPCFGKKLSPEVVKTFHSDIFCVCMRALESSSVCVYSLSTYACERELLRAR